MQPYTCIVVQQDETKHLLQDAMLGSNGLKVLDAPITFVFASDLEPSKRVRRIQELSKSHLPTATIAHLPHAIKLFAGEGALSGAMRCGLASAVSPIHAVPNYVPTVAWSFKQTMLAVQTLMLACQSHGVDTCPMEGFDDSRVKRALDIPDRYSVAVMVSAGFSTTPEATPMPRLSTSELFFSEKFGESSVGLFKK
jgi:nitroreductase